MTAEPVEIYMPPAPSTARYLDMTGPSTSVDRDTYLQIGLADFIALRLRLAELQKLEDGWLDGDGERLQPQILQCARVTLGRLLRLGVPRSRVYPTPEGGVQAEWTIGTREISLTFEPDGTVYAAVTDVTSGTDDELQDGNADQLARFVLQAQ